MYFYLLSFIFLVRTKYCWSIAFCLVVVTSDCRCGNWVHWGSNWNISWPAVPGWFPWGDLAVNLFTHNMCLLCTRSQDDNVIFLGGDVQVKVVLRADVSSATYDKVAIISGLWHYKAFEYHFFSSIETLNLYCFCEAQHLDPFFSFPDALT